MNSATEKILSTLFVITIFVIGIGGIYYFSVSNSNPREVLEEEVVEDIRVVPDRPPVLPNVEKNGRPPLPVKVADVAPMPNTIKDIQQVPLEEKATGDRHPVNLPPNQVYFQVTKEGYAITSGDILMGKVPEDKKNLKVGFFEPPKSKLWETNSIPFAIAKDIASTQPILDAIEYFNSNTVIQFVEAMQDDADVLVFTAIDEHCASHLGRIGGFQPVLISPACGKTEVMHELMHALGFVHEHARKDRDQYISILWANIQEAFLFQFNKMPEQLVHSYTGSVFDFDSESIMLYPDNAFAKSHGSKTMISKGRVSIRPKRGELSRFDKERLHYLYGQ